MILEESRSWQNVDLSTLKVNDDGIGAVVVFDFRSGNPAYDSAELDKYVAGDRGQGVFRNQHYRVNVWVKKTAKSTGSPTLCVKLLECDYPKAAASGSATAFYTSPVTAVKGLVEGCKLVDDVIVPESARSAIAIQLVLAGGTFTEGTLCATVEPYLQ